MFFSSSDALRISVLHCLRARFHSGAYSTSAGITLIAVNPFREVEGCYSKDAVQQYRDGNTKVNDTHLAVYYFNMVS